MADRERLDDEELKALVNQEISNAVTYDDDLDLKRASDYYEGRMPDTSPRPNGSSLMSRDVADTIGWMLPGIIRVFTASDRMAEFEPVGKGDDRFAKEATDYCNHIFWKDNDGYRILWDATHDALLQRNGIVKHWWDDSEVCSYSEHTGMTAEDIALLTQDGGEVVASKDGELQKVTLIDPQTGQPVEQEVPTFDIKLKRVERYGTLKVECIDRQRFFRDSSAITLDRPRFCGHWDEKTRSDLIEMGFDRELVDAIPAFNAFTSENDNDKLKSGYSGHDSMTPVKLYECYYRVDIDGDGIAECLRIFVAGDGGAGELLDWEVCDDDVIFSDIPCEPVPHQFDARSIADETMDIQQVKTVLTRGFAENLYWTNSPLREAEEGSVINPEMLTAPVFGGIVWRKKGTMASTPIKDLPVPFVGEKILMGLEHFDKTKVNRTGSSSATMALDPETLQNQSATANQNQKDASYSQVELIARNMAELGWKRVFKMILRLVVKHQDRPRIIRLRDQPVEMDPRFWNSNMDVTINVGLGTGSRDRDMAMLNNILVTQQGITERLAGAGFVDRALDMLPKIIKTATKLAESAGIRNPDEYYPQLTDQDIGQMKQQAQAAAGQPDPKIQLEKEKLGIEVQKTQMQMQMDAQKNQQDIMLQREKMQGELILKREQLAAEMQLKRDQLIAELQLKRELSMQEMQVKSEQGFYQADRAAEVGRYKADASSRVNMGGEPG